MRCAFSLLLLAAAAAAAAAPGGGSEASLRGRESVYAVGSDGDQRRALQGGDGMGVMTMNIPDAGSLGPMCVALAPRRCAVRCRPSPHPYSLLSLLAPTQSFGTLRVANPAAYRFCVYLESLGSGVRLCA